MPELAITPEMMKRLGPVPEGQYGVEGGIIHIPDQAVRTFHIELKAGGFTDGQPIYLKARLKPLPPRWMLVQDEKAP